MRKGTGIFKQVEEQKTVCDECRQDVDSEYYIHVNAHWSDGWDTYGDVYDFCSLDCMTKYLNGENLPPDNEDVTLDIPVKFLNVLLSKLSD